MAYYLPFDGSNDVAESQAQVFNSVDSYSKLYIEIELEVPTGDNFAPFSSLINIPDLLFIQYRSFVSDASKLRLFYNAEGTRLPTIFPNGLPVGVKFKLGILLENDGAGHNATTFIDGVLEATSAQSGNLQYFPRDFRIAPVGSSAVNVYSAKVEFDDIVVNSWTPATAPATGAVWPADAGLIDLNLIDFAVDPWVFYPDAGGGVTGSSAFNLPKLTLAATGSATQPQPIGNGAFNLNLLTVSSSGTATLPQPEISGAFSLQPVTVSSTGSATLPQPSITGAFSFNALTVSSTGTATLPQPNINGSFSYPLLTVDASGSATTANPFINGSITFNKLTVASTGSATLPQPDITGAFSLPKLTVEGTASALVPQPIINGNIALSKLTISATGEVTLPQPIANGAFNIPFITVSGFATISGLQLIIDRETNVNQQFLSANINQKNLSNNFIYH